MIIVLALSFFCPQALEHSRFTELLWDTSRQHYLSYQLARRCLESGRLCKEAIDGAYATGRDLEAVLGYFRNGVPEDLCL